MQKQILVGIDARQQIFNGIKKISDAVVSTLGPMGKNCIISRCYPSANGMQYYMPFVTKDGVTVAKNITLDNQLENTGALFVRQAAEKTMSDAGDGTTTTCLLLRAIVEKGMELIEKGANPHELKKGIDNAVKYVVEELKKMAIPVSGDIEKIRQVATVSANNDSAIGDLIAEAFSKIGEDGVIDIEEAKGVNTEIKVSDGYKFKRGWISPYFITNHSKNECELIEPYILLYDKKISQFAMVENIIVQTNKQGKPLLIICDDSDGEALAAMASNTVSGAMKVCIVRSPEFGDLKRETMEDLAIITGGTYISDEKGAGLKSVSLRELGKAAKIIVGKEETVIISGNTKKEQLNTLLDNLKMDLTKQVGEEKEKTEKRIATLTGGVAVIYVGAPTEVEMKEKKDRVDDAIRATKAAIAEGYIQGAGNTFTLFEYAHFEGESSYDIGYGLLIDILIYPLKQICENAEVDFEEKIKSIKESKWELGYNAKTNTIENLIESGIIDPVKVLRCSLENAASAAGAILTSNTLICDTL